MLLEKSRLLNQLTTVAVIGVKLPAGTTDADVVAELTVPWTPFWIRAPIAGTQLNVPVNGVWPAGAPVCVALNRHIVHPANPAGAYDTSLKITGYVVPEGNAPDAFEMSAMKTVAIVIIIFIFTKNFIFVLVIWR